ncbi:MAG: cytochrome c [Bacteroidales bacterium]|nr:cytochrome c [Bacteroidales bacterium]MBK9358288.1 cytochrome c [Bacteroidales bacterium]
MKTRNYILIAITSIVGLAVMTSCGGGGKTGSEGTQATEEPAAAAGPSAEQMALGEKIFKEKCIVCHQANGQGIPNVFPSLVGSDFLLNQKVLAVSQVLNGSEHVVANKTVKYPAPMPPQVGTHEEAVAAINYVLNNFGNKGGFVTVDEVKDVVILPR